jgi:Ca-activated chloride channel family protein
MFADKIYLLFLLLIPLLAVFLYIALKKRETALDSLISRTNLQLLTTVNLNAYRIKHILFLVALILIIFALARPKYGNETRTVINESSEIIVALDVSRSMLAEDLKPSRLEKAKMMILRVIEENPGEKIGVIVFSGTAMWQCPMTYDLQAVKLFLKTVTTDVLSFGGTQISNAILLASRAVSNLNSSSGKAMLLISDGENHDSKIKEAVNAAKKVGLKIISVGIGTHEGSPIPLRDKTGSIRDYIRDRNGQVVISKVNSVLLKNAAEETGGKYFDSSNKDISNTLIQAIRNLDKHANKVNETNNKTDRFQIFLFFSLIALFAELLFPIGRKI